MQGVVPLCIPVVNAHIILLIICIAINLLLHVVENHNLYVLSANCFEDSANNELVIGPAFTSEVVEHGTCITVFLLKTLFNHADEYVFLQIFVLSCVDLWLFFSLLGLFGFLQLFQLQLCSLEFLLALHQILISFFSEWAVALLEEFKQLIQLDVPSLLFL